MAAVMEEEEDLERLEKLLLLGSKANHVALDGATPLFVACQKGRAQIVRALSFCGADAHAEVGAMAETPLSVGHSSGAPLLSRRRLCRACRLSRRSRLEEVAVTSRSLT